MLVGSDWAYPGRSVEPSKRWLEHLSGDCKTTAPRIAADETDPIMAPMEDYDFDLDAAPEPNGELRLLLDMLKGKHVPQGYEVVCGVYPYYSKEALGRGRKNQYKNGTGVHAPGTAAKGIETQRRNGLGIFDPKVQSGGMVKAQAPEARSKAVKTMRKDETGFFDPKVGDRGRESMRKNGWPQQKLNMARGRHTRWHINRGIHNSECDYCIGEAA